MTRIRGLQDQDMPIPTRADKHIPDVGSGDELLAFFKATGAATWTGVRAVGSISIAGDETPHAATLLVQNSDHYRLDIDTGQGTDTYRTVGLVANFTSNNHVKDVFAPSMGLLGIVSLPRLLSPAFPGPTTSVTDRGMILVQGKQLHRVCVEEPLPKYHGDPSPEWIPEDFYFDASHRLVRTAAFVRLHRSDGNLYFISSTYDDYRPFGAMLLPTKLTYSINGQLQWTLTLTEQSINPSLSPSAFAIKEVAE